MIFSYCSTDCVARWKIRVTHGDEIKYFLLSENTLVAGDPKKFSLLLNDRFVSFPGGWTSLSHELSLPTRVVGASEIKLYLEVSPSSDFDIDEVSLTEVDNGGGAGGDWEEAAALRIDALRKKDLALQVVMPDWALDNQLVLEVTQLGHKFPFGTAVKSPRIANCWDADNGSHPVNDAYCSFVGENFNWVVDTYRMKWKPMEPMEGQIDTEVKERIKYASFVCKPIPYTSNHFRYPTRCSNGWPALRIQVSKFVGTLSSGRSGRTTPSGCR